MANEEHLVLLKQGVKAWNTWREKNPEEKIDLTGALLTDTDLPYADLKEAKLTGATLTNANLTGADLTRADLTMASLYRVNLTEANLTGADLSRADLRGALLVETNLKNANLTDCHIYGVSAWNLTLEGAQQRDLIITSHDEPVITVDNLEIAQFIHLLFHNEKIRDVIDTITSKAVLILGRFTSERKAILDAIREELRRRNYLPILFDFQKPESRDSMETLLTLVSVSRFIIADLTGRSSIPHELARIAPQFVVPIQPLVERSETPYAMFADFKRYPWILPVYQYDGNDLILSIDKVIDLAEAKVEEIREIKNKENVSH
jgi:hypothetical protein